MVGLGDLFGISEGTIRVALSRMGADGEVIAADGWYELSPRLLDRQRRLDEGRFPGTRAWRGRWELAVVPSGLVGTARTDVLDRLGALRLAALRDGVWLRPANLTRPWPAGLGCDRFDTRPQEDPVDLAARLWDLPGWSERGRSLLDGLEGETEPARRFAVAAAIARHLRTDPVLPRPLLPDDWPGPALRAAYRRYELDLSELLGTVAGG